MLIRTGFTDCHQVSHIEITNEAFWITAQLFLLYISKPLSSYPSVSSSICLFVEKVKANSVNSIKGYFMFKLHAWTPRFNKPLIQMGLPEVTVYSSMHFSGACLNVSKQFKRNNFYSRHFFICLQEFFSHVL